MARTQLNFRLSEEMKQRWKEHVEESRYDDSVSDLVKRAVENQIDRDSGAAAGENPQGGEPSRSTAPSGEVLDRIQDLQNDLQDLQGDVSQAVDAIHAQEGIDPEIPPEVHSALLLGEENAMTAEEVADTAHLSEPQVRFALQNMAENMGDVKRTPEPPVGANPDTEIRWYRVE